MGLVSSEPIKCSISSDCGMLYECKEAICLHKPLSPMEPLEVFGSTLIFIMSALANSTGIGGGEIMVPLLILLFLFETHAAVPLSLMIMLGGSFINTVMRIPHRHPIADRPLISFDLVAYSICPLLIGSTTGVLINRSIPDWLILFCMTALLFYLTVHISMKAHTVYFSTKPTKSTRPPEIQVTVSDYEEKVLETETEPRIFPVKSSLVIMAIYTFALMAIFIRGDLNSPSLIGIKYCSVGFWSIIVGRIVILIIIGAFGISKQIKKNQELISQNYQFSCDVKWTLRKTGFIASIALLGGLGVGLLGIGGGAIMNPALVYAGVRTDVAKATSGAMMLLTCSVAVMHYMTAGMLSPGYATWFFILSVAGASVGTMIIGRLTKKIGKKYIPIITLACVLGITTLVTPTFVITTIVNGMNNSNFQYGFKNFCDN